MLFVYEQHQVIGKHEAAFEDAYRTEFAPTLAKTSDARLLWYFNIAHGAGRSYQIITVTALPDSRTWEALRGRLSSGDLAAWLKAVQSYRYRVDSKVLVPEKDSPFELDLRSVPGQATEADPGLYIEEVSSAFSVDLTTDRVRNSTKNGPGPLPTPSTGRAMPSMPGIELFASFSTAFGTGPTPELTRLYAVKDLAALVDLMTGEPSRPEGEQPLATSRLLRTAPWSPLH